MGLLTGLFRKARKSLQTTDNDMGMFRDKLNQLVQGKDTLTDEEVAAAVEELIGMTNDLPDSDGKAELLRYLEDFKQIKGQDQEVAEKAANAIAGMFEGLDTEAMKDAPDMTEAAGDPAAEEAAEEIVEETEGLDTDGQEEAAEEVVEEEVQKDADPNAEYTLEEIYQFIKKRMAEDTDEEAGVEAEEETVESQDEACEEKEDEVVTDHALNLQLGGSKNSSGLSAMFEKMKNGGR